MSGSFPWVCPVWTLRAIAARPWRLHRIVRRATDVPSHASSTRMLPASLPVILLSAVFCLVPALVMFWAWRRGYFRDLDAQSRVIFEPRDLRVARPWESPVEQLTREVDNGEPAPAEPGEWGGAA